MAGNGLTRRELLGTGGIGAVALAGCTSASEVFADRLTGDLNLFNTSDTQVTGSLELSGPDGERLLEESFDLPPDDNPDNREPAAIYEDLFSASGDHRFTITAVADGQEYDRSTAVSVSAPGEEKLVVLAGTRFTAEFLTVRLVEDFAELESEFEEF